MLNCSFSSLHADSISILHETAQTKLSSGVSQLLWWTVPMFEKTCIRIGTRTYQIHWYKVPTVQYTSSHFWVIEFRNQRRFLQWHPVFKNKKPHLFLTKIIEIYTVYGGSKKACWEWFRKQTLMSAVQPTHMNVLYDSSVGARHAHFYLLNSTGKKLLSLIKLFS